MVYHSPVPVVTADIIDRVGAMMHGISSADIILGSYAGIAWLAFVAIVLFASLHPHPDTEAEEQYQTELEQRLEQAKQYGNVDKTPY